MYLNFISDEEFLKIVSELVNVAREARERTEKDLGKNVIDPFSALVDASYQGLSMDEWIELEKSRQAQKSLQNAIGYFHQKVLGAVEGWENTGRAGSYDVRNQEKGIIAEVKNKFNTMNSSSALATYNKLKGHLTYGEAGYKLAYCVFIIPPKPQKLDAPFVVSGEKKRKDLRQIDGKSFYELVTGDPNALKKVYKALTVVLGETLPASQKAIADSLQFYELFTRAYGK